jgi:hypothetical protein
MTISVESFQRDTGWVRRESYHLTEFTAELIARIKADAKVG